MINNSTDHDDNMWGASVCEESPLQVVISAVPHRGAMVGGGTLVQIMQVLMIKVVVMMIKYSALTPLLQSQTLKRLEKRPKKGGKVTFFC